MTEKTQERAEVLSVSDIRGWQISDPAGENVGSVSDFLLTRRGEVRFVDVDLGFLKHHVLLPVDRVEWSGAERLLHSHWTRNQIRQLPLHKAGTSLTEPMLTEMARAFPQFYGDAEAEPESPEAVQVLPMPQAKQFKLGAETTDPRGWNVFGADGERLGTVAELLVDPETLKVRYIEVDVLDDLFRLSDDRRVLVPLESVELKERGEDAWIQKASAAEVAQLPAYTGGALSPAAEARFLEAWQQTGAGLGEASERA